MKKTVIILAAALFAAAPAMRAQGGLSHKILAEISKGYEGTSADRAIRNALNTTPINTLAQVAGVAPMDTHFSYEVKRV